MKNGVILSLDIATVTGWAISNSVFGTWNFKTKADESDGMKLIRLESKLKEICESQNVNMVVFERPAGRFKKAIMTQSELIAVVKRYCEKNYIPYRGYSAKEIKKFATGNGNAGKPLMIKAAKEKLGYKGSDDNEADALWMLNLAVSEYGEVDLVENQRKHKVSQIIKMKRDLK